MLCYEIWLNGKLLHMIGHEDALALIADVTFHRKEKEQFLNLTAVVWQEGQEAKDCYWLAPRLTTGDEVRIRLVEAESPELPDDEIPYGVRKPPPWGSTDNHCSFCGAASSERKMLFDGYSVKICDACVEFNHRILTNEQSAKA